MPSATGSALPTVAPAPGRVRMDVASSAAPLLWWTLCRWPQWWPSVCLYDGAPPSTSVSLTLARCHVFIPSSPSSLTGTVANGTAHSYGTLFSVTPLVGHLPQLRPQASPAAFQLRLPRTPCSPSLLLPPPVKGLSSISPALGLPLDGVATCQGSCCSDVISPSPSIAAGADGGYSLFSSYGRPPVVLHPGLCLSPALSTIARLLAIQPPALAPTYLVLLLWLSPRRSLICCLRLPLPPVVFLRRLWPLLQLRWPLLAVLLQALLPPCLLPLVASPNRVAIVHLQPCLVGSLLALSSAGVWPTTFLALGSLLFIPLSSLPMTVGPSSDGAVWWTLS